MHAKKSQRRINIPIPKLIRVPYLATCFTGVLEAVVVS